MPSSPQAPQSPLQIWYGGIELGVHVFGKLFLFTSLIGILGLLPTLDLGLRIGDRPVTPESLKSLLDTRWFSIETVCILLSLLVQAVIIIRLDRLAAPEHGAVETDWRQACRSWLPLLGTMVLLILIVLFAAIIAGIVGAITGIVAGLFLGKIGAAAMVVTLLCAAMVFLVVYLIFIQFAVVLDKKRPLAAIDMSFNLVRGNWWRTFLVLLVMGAALGGILMSVSLPMDTWLGWRGGVQTGRVMLEKSVLQLVFSALSGPFIMAILYVQYRDLKLRRRRAESAPSSAALQA